MTAKGYNQQLKALTAQQQLLFCTALAERMQPNHQQVTLQQDPEAAQKARAVLDTLWEKLLVPIAKIDFTKQSEKLQELISDPAEDATLGEFLALDALLAIDIALQQAIQADADAAMSTARLSRASVSRFIECTEELEQPISRHPLMQFEHESQRELLEALAGVEKPSASQARAIKQLILESGVSNIGLERD